jgi:predicted TIM-barrel fold metal-dependent hydrolase
VLTVPRAIALVGALCLAMLALALGATRAVERAHPGITRPEHEPFAPLRIPKIDVHQRFAPGTLEPALRVAQADGIGALVNLSGGAEGGELDAQLAAARPYGDRVIVFMNLDGEGCCGEAWVAREAARLARGKALGARGLAVGQEPPGAGLASGRGEPIWEACAALGLPVALGEVGAPDERIRLIERHPRISFIGTNFWDSPDDPAAVARLMDRMPNLWVDTAGSVLELGLRPESARQAILAHPDRVLFGTGIRYVEAGDQQGIVLGAGQPILFDPKLLGGEDRYIFFASAFRFFETRDADIPSPTPGLGDRNLGGIGLPREVLQRIYHRNAERLLGVHAPRAED